jgi:uncharacterized phage protein gp47/JayE
VSYVPRTYPDIVRDLLTTLTGGVVREAVTVPAGTDPVLVLSRLAERPVRRVSHLTGRTLIGGTEVDHRFTPADFELVDGAVAFRPGGRRPVPLSTVFVNYYPVDARPAPLTDLNVGSVARTLLESVAREIAEQYQHTRLVYESGFVGTATGGSLDKVVALVGVTRLPAGHPVATVRFTRAAGALGRITVPAGTPVTDAAGTRYLTTAELTLEPGEPARTVTARGETPTTALVDAGALDRPEVVIAGIESVVNDEPARALAAAESDEELRRRAGTALHGVVRGTPDALRFAVRSVPGVKDVTLEERLGEVVLTVAYEQDTPEVRAAVGLAVLQTRPAGIRVLTGAAEPQVLDVTLTLTVAGAVPPTPVEHSQLTTGAVERVTAYLNSLPPGGTVRRAQLASAVLGDPRLVDTVVTLLPVGGEPVESYQVAPGSVLRVGTVTVTSVDTELAAAVIPTTATADVLFPAHLAPGVTAASATEALRSALETYLRALSPDRPLTVDALLAAVRDDTRYGAVRADVLVTVTAGERFQQLADGLGEYRPAAGEAVTLGTLDLDVREGVA